MKIKKINEFVDNDTIIDTDILMLLIEEADTTQLADLEEISKSESYRKVVSYGTSVLPYILNRSLLMWDRGLSEITGDGLDPLTNNSTIRVNYWKKWKEEHGY